VLALRLLAMHQQPFWGSAEQHQYGLFPHHLVHGLSAPPGDYLPEAHQGCALPWGAACAPVFAVAGPTRGSLRWCNLAWHLAMFALFALLAARLAGLPGLVATGVLWALAPPAMVAAGHFGWVVHVDAGLLTAALLLCLVRAEDGARRGAWTFAAGLLAGLAVWFHPSALLVVLGLSLAAVATVRPVRSLWPALPGGLLGSAPLVLALLGWEHLPGGLSQGGDGLAARAWSLVVRDLPGVTGFGLLAGAACLVLMAAAVALARWGGRRRLVAVAAAFAVAVHLVGALLSGADLSTGRYLLPAWPWLALLAAGAAPELPGRDRRARLLQLAAVLLAVLCAAPLFSPAREAVPRAWADSRAAWILDEHAFGDFVLPEWEPADVLAIADRTPLDRPAILRAAGRAAARRSEGGLPACPEPDAAALPDWLEGVAEERPGSTGEVEGLPAPARRAHEAGRLLAARRPALEGDAGHWRDAAEGLSEKERDLLCVAYGTWAAPLEWTTEPLREESWCARELFAIGWGAGVARAWLPAGRTPAGDPRLSWWIGEEHATQRLQRAFACGYRAEAERTTAVVAREGEARPWPGDACRQTGGL